VPASGAGWLIRIDCGQGKFVAGIFGFKRLPHDSQPQT
jgi:hypothetical protein